MTAPNHGVIKYEVEDMTEDELNEFYYQLALRYDNELEILYRWFDQLCDDKLKEIKVDRNEFSGVLFHFMEIVIQNGRPIIGKSLHKEMRTIQYYNRMKNNQLVEH